MSTFDRHLLRTFVRVLIISFFSLTGLFVIIDLFNNLEEFITYAQRKGSLLAVCANYYGARVLVFFDRTSALLALIAAIFTVTWLQRTNELTALMAAGIPKTRIVRPLIMATAIVALLACANREFLLPQSRDKLTRNAQDWLGERAQQLTPRTDRQTGIVIDGQHTVAAYQRIEHPSFRLPRQLAQFGRQIVAERAHYRPANEQHSGGYLLEGVSQPENLIETKSASLDGRPVVFSPADTDWLQADECFVTSNITFDLLAAGQTMQQYASTANLIRSLRNPSLDFGADTRVTLHARFVQPLLDITLLFLALPLVLRRSQSNFFVAAGQCLLLVLAYFVIILACQTMGHQMFLLSPALAAWSPLLIFAPLAYTAAQQRWE